MFDRPVSPVCSPPHSPIEPSPPPSSIDSNDVPKTKTKTSVPGTYPDADVNVLEPRQRRCGRKPERCRAWWTHASDECWVVQSEQAVRQHPLRHPFLKIAEPRELQIAPPQEFQLPVSGQEIYDNRIKDQYGLMGVPGVAQWPRVGVRVPYEPMTFDDLKLDPKGQDKTAAEDDSAGVTPEGATKGSSNKTATGDADVMEVDSAAKDKRAVRAKDADERDAFEVHSLVFPLIPMSPNRSAMVEICHLEMKGRMMVASLIMRAITSAIRMRNVPFQVDDLLQLHQSDHLIRIILRVLLWALYKLQDRLPKQTSQHLTVRSLSHCRIKEHTLTISDPEPENGGGGGGGGAR
jgi:hypothetical protein